MVNTAPIWPCVVHVAPVWLTQSHLVHGAPMRQQTPPIWLHLAPIWHMWLPYGAHHSHMAPILEPCSSTHGSSVAHMAPAWSPHSACGSHMAPSASNMVHTAHIQCTQPHMSQAAPTQCHMTPIHSLQLRFCACGSHNGICDSCIVPSSFQMVESGSQMAPIQCTWLPYGTHTSQMAPSASHMAPIQARHSDTRISLYCNCTY
jgi:hypothetical protein